MLRERALWLLVDLILVGIISNGVTALVVPFSTEGRPFCSTTRQSSSCTPLSRLHLALHTDEYNDSPNEEDDPYAEPSTTKASSSSRPRRRPIRPNSEASVAQQKDQEQRVVQAKVRHQEALKDPTLLSDVRFAERTDIHPATKRAIKEVLGHEQMTEIQAKTFAAALQGQSVLGRARTGTGKTLAFLLPALERLMAADITVFRPGKNVGVLIVAPTRELAIQIADEASALLTFHSGDWREAVLCLYGGTKIQRDIALLNKQIPSILVATPGRLQDHLDGTRVRSIKFSEIIAETRLVVLDETDRLLDGFQKETKKILSYLPRPEKRQTLLFSATVPKKLKRVLDEIMPSDYIEVDCITDRDVTSQTNIRVDQSYAVLPTMDLYVAGLVSIVMETMKADPNAKIVVFLPAAKLVKFFADLFNVGLDIPVTEMHSRITQSARNRASSAFRNAKGGVLLTSDVSARGVDYPDVTLVVQYGAPSNRELYIHRLGRTGRAGKSGKGLLVLLPFEASSLRDMSKRRISKDDEYTRIIESSPETEKLMEPVQKLIKSGHSVLSPSAESAYKAFLAYYAATGHGTKGTELMECGAMIASSVGLVKLPSLSEQLGGKLN